MEDYETAAAILGKLRAKKGSIKGLCLAPNVKNKKKVYALICEALKLHSVLEALLSATGLLRNGGGGGDRGGGKKLGRDLALVLVHDCVFAKRGILCGGWMKAAVGKRREQLHAALEDLARKHGVEASGAGAGAGARGETARRVAAAMAAKAGGSEGGAPAASMDLEAGADLPRYVRVNTLRATVADAIKHFTGRARAEPATDCWKFGGVLDDWRAIAPSTFYQDPHLPELLVFPARADLHLDPLYENGSVILQDKASCFPAAILAPPRGAHCIDACAAPGNKTSHLCAQLANTGSVTAYDLDARRLATLRRLTARAGCRVVDARHGSFLDVDPRGAGADARHLARATHLLLDPSCSGSGIVSRLDVLVDAIQAAEAGAAGAPGNAEKRLHKLAAFQVEIILHAMKFPNAQRISYSTCSVHAIENEHVVASVLAAQSAFALAPRAAVLPRWPHRGNRGEGLSDADADAVVRADPRDGTNGFFVALFERRKQQPIDVDQAPEKAAADVVAPDAESESSADEAPDTDAAMEPHALPAGGAATGSATAAPKKRKAGERVNGAEGDSDPCSRQPQLQEADVQEVGAEPSPRAKDKEQQSGGDKKLKKTKRRKKHQPIVVIAKKQ